MDKWIYKVGLQCVYTAIQFLHYSPDVLGVTSIDICMMGFSLGPHLNLPCTVQ